MFSGLDEWGQVEDFIIPRQTDSLPGQEVSMTCLTPRKNTHFCVCRIYPWNRTDARVSAQFWRSDRPEHTGKQRFKKKTQSILPFFLGECALCRARARVSVQLFSEGNYSMSSVRVWLMSSWSKGTERRCPGSGSEATTYRYERAVHIHSGWHHSCFTLQSVTPVSGQIISRERILPFSLIAYHQLMV